MLHSEMITKYGLYSVFGKNISNQSSFSLGQIDISLQLNGNKIRLDTIYYPSEEAKKLYN